MAYLLWLMACSNVNKYIWRMLEEVIPTTRFNYRQEEGQVKMFDPLRKKWLVLTPEEWVRQQVIAWLIQQKGVPPTLISVEKRILVGERERRFDLLVYRQNMSPGLLVECKREETDLNSSVLQQSLSYLSVLPANLLMITNGRSHYAWARTSDGMLELNILPPFDNW
jgi:hypothetical protein